jgi:hypothetical protein
MALLIHALFPYVSCMCRVIEALRHHPRKSIVNTITTTPSSTAHANHRSGSTANASAGGVKRLPFSTLQVVESVEALVQKGLVTDTKRPNPKQRQKLKQQKLSGK